jgi:hypothetical protein
MASQDRKPEPNPIGKIISDEVRKDQGITPTFPLDESEIVEEAVKAPPPKIERPEPPRKGRDRLDADHSYDVGGDRE